MKNNRRRANPILMTLLAGTLAASAATAEPDSCREWRQEHGRWKAETVRRYLTGASQTSLDEALFEVLQREAFLTSCEMPMDRARATLIGWRLVGRTPDEFADAVLEAVLARSGLDPELSSVFPDVAASLSVATRR
jgi:hypothetical protein